MSRIEDLERRLARDPNSKVFAQLAEEYRKAGRLEEAIQTCRDGLEHHPNYFSARVALGRALLESGAYEEASRELETVLAQVPDNILANRFLGQAYEELGRSDDALAKYRVAHMLAPEDGELAERIERLEKTSQEGPPQIPMEPSPVAEAAGRVEPPRPPAVQDVSAFEPEQKDVEPTLIEQQPDVTPPPPPPAAPPPEREGETVFDLEEPEPPRPQRTFVGRQAAEIAESGAVSDEARAIQEELESRSPTGVIKRQKREILESMTPGPASAPPPASVAPPGPSPPPEAQPPAAQPTETSTGEPPKPGVPTATLAELYASQGHLDQALSVYRQLLASQPGDPTVRQRVEELALLVQAQSEPAPSAHARPQSTSADPARGIRETIEVLEGWLSAIRRS